jgi:hypothetical protein
MTSHAAHSGGLGEPTLSLPGPTQLILSAFRIWPTQHIPSARIRPTQLIFTPSPVWPTQLIPSAARIRPAQLIFMLARVRPAQQITCVLSWF